MHTPPLCDRYELFLSECRDKIICTLRKNLEQAQEPPPVGVEKRKHEERKKRYDVLKPMIEEPKHTRRGTTTLERILRGYLVEFLRQTEEEIPAYNVEHGKNPSAAAYWADNLQEFRVERLPSCTHTASAYNRVRTNRNTGEHSAAWGAIGEIIRVSIDTFKKEYSCFDPSRVPMASIYNNQEDIIRLAVSFQRRLSGHNGTSRE